MRLDMSDYLTIWEEFLGNTWASWGTKEAHYTLLIKDGDVVGHFKTTGHGIFWELPEELLSWKKPTKESETGL